MNIGKKVKVIEFPEVLPSEKPIKVPNWPVKEPSKVPDKIGIK